MKELSLDFILRKQPKVKEASSGEVSIPTAFAKFDNEKAETDRIMARFFATRDKAIMRERAKKEQLA